MAAGAGRVGAAGHGPQRGRFHQGNFNITHPYHAMYPPAHNARHFPMSPTQAPSPRHDAE